MEPILLSIFRGHDQVRAAADRLTAQTGYRRSIAVEEVLADLAAAGKLQQQGFWQRLGAAMLLWLRPSARSQRSSPPRPPCNTPAGIGWSVDIAITAQ